MRLHDFDRLTLEQYLADAIVQSAVERRLQVAIQICIDIATEIVARAGFRTLCNTLLRMVRFRNILVHGYAEVDPRRVYQFLRSRLSDFRRFARRVEGFVQRNRPCSSSA
ncbi:MAG: DUF86 domain-containing protein [Abditibacteriales bacterium]|nr:DUF86 domain-containing protein [Abditibacteriales bacterium]